MTGLRECVDVTGSIVDGLMTGHTQSRTLMGTARNDTVFDGDGADMLSRGDGNHSLGRRTDTFQP